MAIDPSQIHLTQEQKEQLALRADQLGVDPSTLLDDLFDTSSTSEDVLAGQSVPSVLERMKAAGAVGCAEGPGDLSTNPKYLEGFGGPCQPRK